MDEARIILRAELERLEDLGALQQEHEPDWVALEATGRSLATEDARAAHGLYVAQQRNNYLTSQRLFAVEQRASMILGLLAQMADAISDLRERVATLEGQR